MVSMTTTKFNPVYYDVPSLSTSDTIVSNLILAHHVCLWTLVPLMLYGIILLIACVFDDHPLFNVDV